MDNTFSCVIPVYNNFDLKRVHLSLDSVLIQENKYTEAVVVECNEHSKLENVSNNKRVKYVFIPAGSSFNTGEIRNAGVLATTRPLIYMLDGDIVFQSPDYLNNVANILNSKQDLVLRHPPMRRLLIDSFDVFWQYAIETGLVNALDALNRSSPYVATAGTQVPPILTVVTPPEKGGLESWTTTEELYNLYKSRLEMKELVPLIFCGTRHWGGLALKRVHFDHVGGYANCFKGWGNEDTDLQWKLDECFNLEFFPDDCRYEVLHLDHDKPYFTPEKWLRNKAMAKIRTEQGVGAVLEQDKVAYSFLRRQFNG